jgi:ribose transport system substrate-binding protein
MIKTGFGIVLALAAVLAGCGKPEAETSIGKAPGRRKTIYLIAKASESEFWHIVIAGARKAAADLGAQLVAQAPVSESDVSKQIGIMESAISARPDAIVLAPTVADALVPAIEKAAARKLPVVIIDSQANTDKYVAFLASDNVKIGELGADMLANALQKRFAKAEGEVACITYMSGVGSLERRKTGFLRRIAEKYPGIKIVDFQDAQGKQGTAMSIVQNYLTAYPNLRGIFTNNNITGDETVRALDMRNRKDLAVVLVDSGPQINWGLANGYVDSVIVQKPWSMGYMGVEWALKAIKGERLPKEVDTGVAAITPDMLLSGAAKELLDPLEFHGVKK